MKIPRSSSKFGNFIPAAASVTVEGSLVTETTSCLVENALLDNSSSQQKLGHFFWTIQCHECDLKKQIRYILTILLMKESLQQLRLVVFPIMYLVLYIPGGAWFMLVKCGDLRYAAKTVACWRLSMKAY